MRNTSKMLAFSGLALVVLQAFPVDRTAPPDGGPLVIHDAAAADIVDRACADCHTNDTEWPWYSRVAPMSWWIANHVREGRSELNLSTWMEMDLRRQFGKLGEVIDYVESGEMPLPSYTWAHPESRLTADERESLVRWAKDTRSRLRLAADRDAEEMEAEATRALPD
jgi:hypothetical protein